MMGDGAEALVVGAGPAGSATALRLARRGVEVLVLDAATFPRSKPCGDCLSPGATPILEELGVRDSVESAGAGRLEGWRMRTPRGTWFRGRFRRGASPGSGRRPAPDAGYALPRTELDALLVRAARDAGARVRDGTRVSGLVRRDGRVRGVRARGPGGEEQRFRARIVVGADGLRSVVARRLAGVERGPRPRLALVGRFAGVGADPRAGNRGRALGEMRLDRDGCLGLAPLGRGRWNATLVVPAGRAREISRDREAFFRHALDRYGVAGRFRNAERLGALEITGPFRVTPRRRTAPGVLLAGDAAGYFDPLTGQGIYRALAVSRPAAEAVVELLAAPPGPARAAIRLRYRRALEALVGPGRRVQKTIDAVTRRRGLIEPAGLLLRHRPGLADLLVDVTGDRAPVRALADPRHLLSALRTP